MKTIALAVLALLYSGCGDDKEWEAFKKVHACKVTGQISESLTSRGDCIASKTCWLCNDGITYCR